MVAIPKTNSYQKDIFSDGNNCPLALEHKKKPNFIEVRNSLESYIFENFPYMKPFSEYDESKFILLTMVYDYYSQLKDRLTSDRAPNKVVFRGSLGNFIFQSCMYLDMNFYQSLSNFFSLSQMGDGSIELYPNFEKKCSYSLKDSYSVYDMKMDFDDVLKIMRSNAK